MKTRKHRSNSDLQRRIPRNCIQQGFGFGIFVYTIWSFLSLVNITKGFWENLSFYYVRLLRYVLSSAMLRHNDRLLDSFSMPNPG